MLPARGRNALVDTRITRVCRIGGNAPTAIPQIATPMMNTTGCPELKASTARPTVTRVAAATIAPRGYGAGHDSRREYVGLYLQVGEQDGGNDDGRNQARLECDDGRDARSDDRPDNGDERTNKGDQRKEGGSWASRRGGHDERYERIDEREDDLSPDETTNRLQNFLRDRLHSVAGAVRDQLVRLRLDGRHGESEVDRQNGHDDHTSDGVDDAGANL